MQARQGEVFFHGECCSVRKALSIFDPKTVRDQSLRGRWLWHGVQHLYRAQIESKGRENTRGGSAKVL
jgi:hypothetical protein